MGTQNKRRQANIFSVRCLISGPLCMGAAFREHIADPLREAARGYESFW